MTFKEFASRINVNVDNAPDDCDMSLEITVENCIDIINMLGSQIRHLQEREISGKQGKVSPDWHTGTPTYRGRYLVSNGYDTSISYFDGKEFTKDFLGFPDVGDIVKWQKIEP